MRSLLLQQHKRDLRRIYKREYEFSKSSLFTRMLCGFLPECIAPSTRVHCATNNMRLWHCCDVVLFLRGLQLRQVSGYGLLWLTCKAMWARSCLAFTTLAVVVNAEFESLEIWTIKFWPPNLKVLSHDHQRCVIHVCISLSILFSCGQFGNLNLLAFGVIWV